MKRASLALALAICTLTDAALASDITLVGRTFVVRTDQGRAQVTYSTGTMSGVAVSNIGLSISDKGVWYKTGFNQICQKWDNWLSGSTQCLTLRPVGTMVKWTDQNGQTGFAR